MSAFPIFPLLALAAVIAGPASVPSRLPPPTGKWVLNYADTYCTLSRIQNGAEPGIAFRTRPFADDHELLLTLQPTAIRRFRAQGLVFAGDLPVGPERQVDAIFARKANLTAIESTIRATELAAAMTSGRLRLVVPGRIDTSMRLPAAAKATAALKACEDDLARRWKIVRDWSVDPLPLADPRSIFTGDDYPMDMVDGGKTGAVRALLAIDTAGKVTECRIIESSSHVSLDTKTCAVLSKRVVFTSARGPSGLPIASYYLAPNIRWVLEYD